MAYSKKKNLISNRDVYNRCYGDFRGVDFSSDHTQVTDQRLAYSVNMYKDYRSGQGNAIETIPGFREIFKLVGEKYNDDYEVSNIWGLHPFRFEDENKNKKIYFFVHCHDKLYKWAYYDAAEGIITPAKEAILVNDCMMSAAPSSSFVFNNRLYIIDGSGYYCFDGSKVYSVSYSANSQAYIPTTYINIVPGGDNRNIGEEYEPVNLLQRKFKHTFIADGETKEYPLNALFVNDYSDVSVKVYGESFRDFTIVTNEEGFGVSINFTSPPETPLSKGYAEDYAGVEITAKYPEWDSSGKKTFESYITKCTRYAIFDNRVFLSGNPDFPNRVYFCGMHDGYSDPTYFPDNYYFETGVSSFSGVTGMLAVSDSLVILKSDTVQDGSVYYYKPVQTGDNLYPVRYEGTRGLSGIGCLGACINFLDDPVFVSRLGLEGIGQLSIRLERAIEHRSSLVDAKIINQRLANAVLEEWDGYLVLLVEGKIFLADSRQRYTHETGVMQYEWYYLEDIGVYIDQYKEYRYAVESYGLDSEDVTITTIDGNEIFIELCSEDMRGEVVNPPNIYGNSEVKVNEDIDVIVTEGDTDIEAKISYVTIEGKNYLCTTKGNYIGGRFSPAVTVKSFDNNLFFGTQDGHFCSFNFDKRDEEGNIPTESYSFNGRAINCGCATKMDNCGIPHLTKNTVKRSTVIKTKAFDSSAAKIKVRTNNEPYKQIDRISSRFFSFNNLDFEDFTFDTAEQNLFSISEKEKRWVEKQYYIYSDEYLKPFALFYIAFRYNVCGRYKK